MKREKNVVCKQIEKENERSELTINQKKNERYTNGNTRYEKKISVT